MNRRLPGTIYKTGWDIPYVYVKGLEWFSQKLVFQDIEINLYRLRYNLYYKQEICHELLNSK